MKNSQKRNQKTSKYIKIAVLCVSFIVIICMMFLIYNDMKDKKHHTADDSADNKEYSSIEVDFSYALSLPTKFMRKRNRA